MSDTVLPGDKIALVEEYEAGENSYDDDGLIRSTIVGKSQMNKKERLVDVENHLRNRSPALIKDIVKARVLGTLNGVIHATIRDKELGVLFTKCRKCGENVVLFRDIVKCIECGWTDDRKISTDFLQSNFLKMRE